MWMENWTCNFLAINIPIPLLKDIPSLSFILYSFKNYFVKYLPCGRHSGARNTTANREQSIIGLSQVGEWYAQNRKGKAIMVGCLPSLGSSIKGSTWNWWPGGEEEKALPCWGNQISEDMENNIVCGSSLGFALITMRTKWMGMTSSHHNVRRVMLVLKDPSLVIKTEIQEWQMEEWMERWQEKIVLEISLSRSGM